MESRRRLSVTIQNKGIPNGKKIETQFNSKISCEYLKESGVCSGLFCLTFYSFPSPRSNPEVLSSHTPQVCRASKPLGQKKTIKIQNIFLKMEKNRNKKQMP